MSDKQATRAQIEAKIAQLRAALGNLTSKAHREQVEWMIRSLEAQLEEVKE